MGLDITAYSKLEYIETMNTEAWENKYWMHRNEMPYRTAHATHWIPALAERAEGIVEDGVYKVNGERFDFRAGSYSGYNDWREWLSVTMLGVTPRTIWQNAAKYQGFPFYELINFSDAEGIIGPVVAAKLATDFAVHQKKAEKEGRADDGWYARKYAEWRKAFELASDGGMVEFH